MHGVRREAIRGFAVHNALFDFLRGLPEEQIRRDGGAQNGADQQDLVLTKSDGRYDGVF